MPASRLDGTVVQNSLMLLFAQIQSASRPDRCSQSRREVPVQVSIGECNSHSPYIGRIREGCDEIIRLHARTDKHISSDLQRLENQLYSGCLKETDCISLMHQCTQWVKAARARLNGH